MRLENEGAGSGRAVRAVETFPKGNKRRRIRNSWKPPIAEFLGKTALFWSDLLNGVQEVAGSNPVAPTLQGLS